MHFILVELTGLDERRLDWVKPEGRASKAPAPDNPQRQAARPFGIFFAIGQTVENHFAGDPTEILRVDTDHGQAGGYLRSDFTIAEADHRQALGNSNVLPSSLGQASERQKIVSAEDRLDIRAFRQQPGERGCAIGWSDDISAKSNPNKIETEFLTSVLEALEAQCASAATPADIGHFPMPLLRQLGCSKQAGLGI
jgi:hypothetical protein